MSEYQGQHRTTNSAFVSTRTSLWYVKMNKYIQEHKLQEAKCRCKKIQITKDSSRYGWDANEGHVAEQSDEWLNYGLGT